MMFAPRIVYGPLALMGLAAFAQPTQEATQPPAKVAVREPVPDADTQLRRALLRASLRAQPDEALVGADRVKGGRLLSDQDRADLRRQLRQQ